MDHSLLRIITAIALSFVLPGAVLAQDLFIYPSKGQNQTQQDRDRSECHTWAVQQSGFDPKRQQQQASAPPPPAAAEPPQGGVVRGSGPRGCGWCGWWCDRWRCR